MGTRCTFLALRKTRKVSFAIMDEKATMGQPLRSTEDEETIDLMELARLLCRSWQQLLRQR